MYILTSILLIFSVLILLVIGLASVLHDLLQRSPYNAPMVKDDVTSTRQTRDEIAPSTTRFLGAGSGFAGGHGTRS